MLSGVSDLLLAAVAVVVVGAGLVAAGVAVTWIRIRRRLRALRSHTAVRTGVALLGVVRSGGALRWRDGWSGWLAASSNAPAVLRLQMWQAVDAATRAVETAERTGGAVGDLPSLCRRLRVASEELDRLLALAGRDGGLSGHADGLGRQVADVRDAASSIRRAALVSAGDAAAVRMGPLADDARREVECVTAGVARAGDALGGGRRAE